MKTQILNGKVLTPMGWIENGSVLIEDTKIADVLRHSSPVEGVDKVIDVKGAYVLPGGVEMHVHGGGGRDFMETTEEAFVTAVAAHRAHGTTSIFPTLSSSTTQMISDAAETCEKLMKDPMSGVLGLHLEGPYFNLKMAGGQLPENIRLAQPEEYKALIERFPCIRRWDAAPELDNALEFARYARSKGVVVSLGHTAARKEDVERGYEAGFNLATHLYNGMTSLHKEGMYRQDGTAEAVHLNDGINVEVICDGIHVPPVLISMIYKIKGVERMALITYALACAASDSKVAFDPRVKIDEEVGVCMLSDGSALAGSIATMDRLIRTCVKKAGIPLEDVARMASETPSRIMGVYDRKGSLQAGKDADIMVFDEDLILTHVVQMGREVEVAAPEFL